MSSSSRFLDWSLLVICNLIWASYFVMVKLVQDEMGPLFATSFPMLIAAFLLLIFLILREPGRSSNGWRRLSREDVRDLLLMGVLGQAVTQFFGVWGGQLSPASNASLIMLALPIVTAATAFLILKERMTLLRWLGFGLSIAGVVVCTGIEWGEIQVRSSLMLLANAMLFLSVVASAFYNVYSKRILPRRDPVVVLFWSYVVALTALLPPTALFEPEGFARIPHFTLTAWGGLLVLAILYYFLAMVIFLTVLTRLDATQAGLSNYMIPFFGVVLAGVILGERLAPSTMLGGGLILLGTVSASFDKTTSEPITTRTT